MSIGYHPENLKLQPYDHEKVKELIGHAVRLGIQFKINGIPFGAPYDRDLWRAFNAESSFPRASSNGDQAHWSEQGHSISSGPQGAVIGRPRG